jgi:hypothetical protein
VGGNRGDGMLNWLKNILLVLVTGILRIIWAIFNLTMLWWCLETPPYMERYINWVALGWVIVWIFVKVVIFHSHDEVEPEGHFNYFGSTKL